jgi:hypothetical protein
MSMEPGPWPEVPTETARIARKAFPKGVLPIRVRDELGGWCADEQFGAAYPVRGAPGSLRHSWRWSRCCSSPKTSPTARRPTRSAADCWSSTWRRRSSRRCWPGCSSGARCARAAHRRHPCARRDLLDKPAGTGRRGGTGRAGGAGRRRAGLAARNDRPVRGRALRGRIDSWRLPASQRKRAALAVQYGRDSYRSSTRWQSRALRSGCTGLAKTRPEHALPHHRPSSRGAMSPRYEGKLNAHFTQSQTR